MSESIISLIEAQSVRFGWTQKTFCLRAIGNARLPERLKRRAEYDEEIRSRILSFVASNPPDLDMGADTPHATVNPNDSGDYATKTDGNRHE
ncbi:hypothetical protein JI664_21555 [Rhodobacter sp. NTK016B]|uniref:hypothetical protein n=1 Tax=Rhodobacter sp. NTK016B TaxID=2759676 RepID=UPI001A8DCE68|nr:hypothetical protein [Rhodobacter sp. NTK016B]MBN8294574.1 hypothetical protein [Rhodobacter sp. NTK016B]